MKEIIFTVLAMFFITIGKAQPVITYPNGGEILEAGSTIEITWSGTPLNTVVGIDYTIDNWGTTIWLDVNFQNPDANSYTWIVPDTPGSQCKIGIFDTNFEGDISDNFFIIVGSTGLPENLRSDILQVFPNPAGEIVHITGANHSFTLVNNLGQEIPLEKVDHGNGHFSFRVLGMPPGMYTIRQNNEKGESTVTKLLVN